MNAFRPTSYARSPKAEPAPPIADLRTRPVCGRANNYSPPLTYAPTPRSAFSPGRANRYLRARCFGIGGASVCYLYRDEGQQTAATVGIRPGFFAGDFEHDGPSMSLTVPCPKTRKTLSVPSGYRSIHLLLLTEASTAYPAAAARGIQSNRNAAPWC